MLYFCTRKGQGLYMNNADRVIANSVLLYIKIIITTLISIASVPIVMHALGNSDYGLYSLVGGTVGLMAFMKSAMTVSTQRFLSVAVGEGNVEHTNRIYNNSIILHYLVGFFMVLVFEAAYPLLFNGFLNIDADRVVVAKWIYQFLALAVFLDITSVPFIGVVNAKEDMFVFCIVGIVEALLKLLLALSLGLFLVDKLLFYGVGMMLIALLIRCFYSVYVRMAYREFDVHLSTYVDKATLREITGFTGWNSVGALALVGRNQGLAIVINIFFNTVENAAYGIANQINGVMGFVANTFQKSINPQLMKSHGMHDKQRLVRLAYLSSKFSVLLFAALALPLIIEMDYILKIWLKTPPVNTVIMTQLVLILSLLNQYSMGLMSSIQATGNIRNYQIVVSILILLNIPITYVLYSMGLPSYSCGISFIVIEIISFVYRLYMARKMVGMNIRDYVVSVLTPTLSCMACATAGALCLHYAISASMLRLVIVTVFYMLVYGVSIWTIALNETEKDIFNSFSHKIIAAVKAKL